MEIIIDQKITEIEIAFCEFDVDGRKYKSTMTLNKADFAISHVLKKLGKKTYKKIVVTKIKSIGESVR